MFESKTHTPKRCFCHFTPEGHKRFLWFFLPRTFWIGSQHSGIYIIEANINNLNVPDLSVGIHNRLKVAPVENLVWYAQAKIMTQLLCFDWNSGATLALDKQPMICCDNKGRITCGQVNNVPIRTWMFLHIYHTNKHLIWPKEYLTTAFQLSSSDILTVFLYEYGLRQETLGLPAASWC